MGHFNAWLTVLELYRGNGRKSSVFENYWVWAGNASRAP